MALIADNPDDHADQLALLTERLTALMQRERACLDANDMDGAAPLTDEIGRLGGVYRMEIMRVNERPDLLRGASEAMQDRLRLATEKFRQNLVEHEESLRRARDLTEGLVRAIAEEVARSRPAPSAYGVNGQTPTRPGSLAINAVA